MKKFAFAMAVLTLGASAPAAAMKPPPPPPPAVAADNPFGGGATLYNLTWTNICSSSGEGGPFFPTCASASLFLYDDGWMELRFWNRSGINGTWEGSAVKAIGLSGVPAGDGDGDRGLLTGDAWDAYFGAAQIAWAPEAGNNGIQGPNDADGWKTSGNGDAFCSGIDNVPAVACPPSNIVTPWTTINGAGYAGFYWFVGDAIELLDPSKITLQMHVGSGPGGASTGYACFSDGYEQYTYVDDKGKTWICNDNPDDPGDPQDTVPEPATMTLLATGLVGLAAARRKRNKIKS